MGSINKEISKLKCIKQQLLYNQQIASLPSFYFSNFLLGYDKEQKIIIMGSFHGLLRLITPISKIYSTQDTSLINMVDGMFRLPRLAMNTSLPWKQLLQIHTVIESHDITRRSKSFPCVWILLKNKKKKTYISTIQLLKKIIREKSLCIFIEHYKKHHNFDSALTYYYEYINNDKVSSKITQEAWIPNKICTDFERGLINSYTEQFIESTSVKGCYFHFTQSIIKKIGTLRLRVEFKINKDFKNMVLLLFACAYLPQHSIHKEIDNILVQITLVCSNSKKLAILAFVRYFRRTWLKSYPPLLWCVYGRRDRTNNLLERNNGVIKDYCKKTTYFPDYVNQLCKLDAEATVEYERLRCKGINNFSLKRLNQRIKDTELEQLQIKYDQHILTTQQYLQSIVQLSFTKPADLYRLQQLLEQYELHIPPTIQQFQQKVSNIKYITDTETLAIHRRHIFNNTYTEKVVTYIRNTETWKQITKKKTFFTETEVTEYRVIKRVRPIDLVNAFVLIQYGKRWSPSFIAIAEYRDALAITNDSWKYEVVIDMQNAINNGHVLAL